MSHICIVLLFCPSFVTLVCICVFLKVCPTDHSYEWSFLFISVCSYDPKDFDIVFYILDCIWISFFWWITSVKSTATQSERSIRYCCVNSSVCWRWACINACCVLRVCAQHVPAFNRACAMPMAALVVWRQGCEEAGVAPRQEFLGLTSSVTSTVRSAFWPWWPS